ncbi:MAG: hypothetical protein ACRD0W_04060 [Acidimicrobiales bacterium]
MLAWSTGFVGGDSSVLVIRGEAGIGKTVLLGVSDADAAPCPAVFLLGSGSVAHLRELQGGTALIDRRRFRPNLYVDTEPERTDSSRTRPRAGR